MKLSYKEKKERCKKCKYAHQSESALWSWPCDQCLGATVTLVEPTGDYYEEAESNG